MNDHPLRWMLWIAADYRYGGRTHTISFALGRYYRN
jgi:hypothetical protein